MKPYQVRVEARFARGTKPGHDYRTRCYEMAFKYLAGHRREPALRLVHGTLHIMKRLYPHAWVELPGRWVSDPADQTFYDRDAYYREEQADAVRVYTVTEVDAEALRTGHYGPWHAEEATMPHRIQRQRRRGWRLPATAVSVTRPGRWGNPFRIGKDGDRVQVVQRFETYARDRLAKEPGWLDPLRGKDLACWCPPGEACHADILLRLANASPPAPA
jgi:hypothetical protein